MLGHWFFQPSFLLKAHQGEIGIGAKFSRYPGWKFSVDSHRITRIYSGDYLGEHFEWCTFLGEKHTQDNSLLKLSLALLVLEIITWPWLSNRAQLCNSCIWTNVCSSSQTNLVQSLPIYLQILFQETRLSDQKRTFPVHKKSRHRPYQIFWFNNETGISKVHNLIIPVAGMRFTYVK